MAELDLGRVTGESAYEAARNGGYTGTEADFNAIMAIIEKHASRHKAGGADPLTAADVGAAPSEHNHDARYYTKDFMYPSQNGGDLNTYKTPYKGFVFNMANSPFIYHFLDVEVATGSGFAPNGAQPIIRQTAVNIKNGAIALRTSENNGETWHDWLYVATTDFVTRLSRKNLLDNWYFADPINQRGQTTYTDAIYAIDRWRNLPALGELLSIDINENGIAVLKSALTQVIDIPVEEMIGKTVTISALFQNNVLVSASGLIDAADPFEGRIRGEHDSGVKIELYRWSGNGFSDFCFLAGVERSICADPTNYRAIAAKLELGSTQTLAHQDADGNWVLNDPPPNKALELMKCQRYYYQSWDGDFSTHNGPTIAGKPVAPGRMPTVLFPHQMRNTPSITLYGALSGAKDVISDWASDEDTITNAVGAFVTARGFIPADLNNLMDVNTSYHFHYSASADL